MKINVRRRFRTAQGTKIVNEISYCFEILKKYPDCKIYVGSDSQSHRRSTVFATVIAFRYGLRGAHYIYAKDIVRPKIRHIEQRLTEEVYRTMDIVDHLIEGKVPIHSVDFDFNEDEVRVSNKLVTFATGWAKGFGLETHVKPDELVATKAADHIVNKKLKRSEK